MSTKKSKSAATPDPLDQLSFFTSTVPDNEETAVRTDFPSHYQKSRLYKLHLEELLPDPSQPRQYLDNEGLNELAASIKRHGLLEPVLFRQEQDSGQLYIVAGSRRLAAAKLAGIKVIPGILAEGDPAEIALVENLIRQDLTCIEEAEALERLKARHGYTLAELADLIGKSVPTLSEIISLTRLAKQIRDECRNDRKIARSILVEIAKLASDAEMIALYNRYRCEGMSRADLRNSEKAPKKEKKGFTRLFRSFSRQLTAIDTAELAERERQKVRKELEDLRTAIDDKLAGLTDR